ncbi:MAG: hypothetical protein OEX18_06185 [Candidatus Krumholzibacteria bacterium]|nr:hypothetical protein [Candidatus Krumholzibacteria bacterium]MDH4336852.1 hypothetical protein [Candidatus Krumholzibacteria bacterium]MDH5269183.1 hypothetical protein [Candidatus Krumholzibacteria bacterium]MDH5627910.1 hypothetical protein [Candidatus Krumholzibacteria bacterium]
MTLVTDSPPAVLKRRRLSGRTEPRGSQTGFSVWGAVLFGFVFVAVGSLIVLVGRRIIPVDPSGVHAPWWVLTVAGISFAGGGLAVWGMAARQQRAEHYRRGALRRYAGSSAHADHPWNPAGERSRPWPRAGKAILGAAFLTVFLSMFNWWAWGPEGPGMVKVVVTIFDLILVLVWWQAVVRVGQALKFASSRVVFDRFPYSLDKPVAIRWIPPRGVGPSTKGEFTLRCVEEFYEERGSGKDRSKHLVHEEICAETQAFDHTQSFAPGRPVEFRFTLPEGAPSTALSALKPVFWEFEVKLGMPGFDFEEQYLIPIYSSGA